MQENLVEGFGIFKGLSCLEYLTNLNPIFGGRIAKQSSHFSFWSYSHYHECPLRFFWLLVEKKPPRVPPDRRNTLEGGAMHEVVDRYVHAGLPSDWKQWFVENSQLIFDEYLKSISAGFRWKSLDDSVNAYQDYCKIANYALNYLCQLNAITYPKRIYTESPFALNIAPGISLGGRIDCALVFSPDKEQGFIDVVDWKGTKFRGSVSREQFMFYGLGAMVLWRKPVRNFRFVYAYFGEDKVMTFSDVDYEAFIFNLLHSSERIKLGQYEATKKVEHCKWCVFSAECEHKPSVAGVA